MGAFRFSPDAAPAPTGADRRTPKLQGLGTEVARWLRDADRRLLELSAPAASALRADDFGHVTPRHAEGGVHRPMTELEAARPHKAALRVTDLTDRSGIVVAQGWGERPRRY